jgi:hypothetical protein
VFLDIGTVDLTHPRVGKRRREVNVSFSTINKDMAKRYFEHESWDYLSDEAKELALKYCGEGVLRVQDPMMYPSPCLEITDEKIYKEIMNIVMAKDPK